MPLSKLTNEAIPELVEADDWRDGLLWDNGERLVELYDDAASCLRVRPYYAGLDVPGAVAACYLRQSVASKLAEVARQLKDSELSLLVLDGWRPLAVQQSLYDAFKEQLRRQHPAYPTHELDRQTRQFVATPSKHPAWPSPHYTGGAVDLTLADHTGRELPMGTAFDDFSPQANTRYYEDLNTQRPLSQEERTSLQYRRLLYHLLTGAGFANYSGEWWHFDYGNQRWGVANRQVAFYGTIEPVSPL